MDMKTIVRRKGGVAAAVRHIVKDGAGVGTERKKGAEVGTANAAVVRSAIGAAPRAERGLGSIKDVKAQFANTQKAAVPSSKKKRAQ